MNRIKIYKFAYNFFKNRFRGFPEIINGDAMKTRIHVAGWLPAAILILLVPFAHTPAWGSVVDDCHTVAVNFLEYIGSDKTIAAAEMLRANVLAPDQPEVDIAYLARLSGGGYLLVGVSRDRTPVKAYSLKYEFGSLPPAYKDFLLKEAEYNVRTAADAGGSRSTAGLSENQQRWDFLLNYGSYRTTYTYTPDTWLLTTQWNQDSNRTTSFCPRSPASGSWPVAPT